MKLNKKGMTLIEIIVSLALISVVLIFLINLFINIRRMYNTSKANADYDMQIARIVKAIGDDIDRYGLYCIGDVSSGSEGNSYILIFNADRTNKKGQPIKKVLSLKEATIRDFDTKKDKTINMISYGYDMIYTKDIIEQERLSKVTSEMPIDAMFGVQVGGSVIESRYEDIDKNRQAVELSIPILTNSGTDYSVNVYGIASKTTTAKCSKSEIESPTMSTDPEGPPDPIDPEEPPITPPESNIIENIKNSAKTGNPNFAEPATTDEGVYTLMDDYGTSYYYRGAVTNNYVKFAGFYWRIIRINGDGSLRIIYDGTQGYANGTSDTGRLAYTSKAFNAQYNDAKYVGWMYGGAQGTASTSKAQAQTNTTSSDLKTLVDSWYKTNIVDKNLGDKVADVVFCNDRTIPGSAETGYLSDTGLGYGYNRTAYGATARVGGPWQTTVTQPRFTCPQKNDAFTVSDETKGNGDLTYPVGLITADEIVAAGNGKCNTSNSSYYLYKGSVYWSLSPSYFNGSDALVFYESTVGSLYNTYVNYSGAVAPVINLKAEYAITLKGTGTISDPYRESGVTP